ncbi:hypothetical protein RGU12_06650 [Fredinandcohnia sp. QZ13]|uniref:hypothetical protein n=1 Tax=Fredinandcohnia sp. QZ13 TaxID=3073144 RepID=UPI00285309F5|nr:hypothetical protein [Fredinandcohnia sp. QZ13]MDR4887236.1 hypothetical protein [Fredinandcohnia sp. QZ13]
MSEVQQFIRDITTKAKDTFSNTSQLVKEKINTVLQRPMATIDDLAQYISAHPDTSFDTKEFLGFQYHFYHLKVSDFVFYLETKGDHGDYILDLSVCSPEGTLFEYHSFEKKYGADEKVPIPAALASIIQ